MPATNVAETFWSGLLPWRTVIAAGFRKSESDLSPYLLSEQPFLGAPTPIARADSPLLTHRNSPMRFPLWPLKTHRRASLGDCRGREIGETIGTVLSAAIKPQFGPTRAPPREARATRVWQALARILQGNKGLSLLQATLDLFETRLGAGFVLVAAGGAAHADSGDRVVADLDG